MTENPTTVRRRLVALTGTLSAFAALGLVLVVQVILAGASTEAVTRVLSDRADTVVTATDVDDDGRLSVPDARLAPGVQVYDADGERVAGSVPPSLGEVFARLSTSDRERTEEVADEYSVLARPFRLDDGTAGVVVLAEAFTPYEDDEHAALAVSVSAGLLMVLLATAVAAWISRRALAPVQVMADTAREWSEHDLDRRFDLGPPTDEIRALGATLDGLLERVASAIRAEQRLTAELAHELRSPLTAVQATAELMSMRDDLDDELRDDVADVLTGCRTMASTMTVLLEVARTQTSDDPGGTTTGAALSRAVVEAVPDDRLDVDLPDDLVVSAAGPVVLRVLSPVLDNALRVAGRVTLTFAHTAPPGRVALLVRDDGPGVDPALVGRLFEPGTTIGGSGLGLALARRVARSAGGDVALLTSAGPGGTTFVITLPGSVSDQSG